MWGTDAETKVIFNNFVVTNHSSMCKPYICRKCGRAHSYEEYAKSRFCLNCGTWLGPPKSKLRKRKKENLSVTGKIFIDVVECLECKSNKEYLRSLAIEKRRDEKWLKRQVVSILRECGITPFEEKSYPFPSQERCDIYFQIGQYEYWLEMKTFPTNYCGGGKPITNFIEEAVSTIAKLAKISSEQRRILALFLFYPFCGSAQEVKNWEVHIQKIRKACDTYLHSYKFNEDYIIFDFPLTVWESENMKLRSHEAEARIYFIEKNNY